VARRGLTMATLPEAKLYINGVLFRDSTVIAVRV
jgi:hypothetical protein